MLKLQEELIGVWTEHNCEKGTWDEEKWYDYRDAPPISSEMLPLRVGTTLIPLGPPATVLVLRGIFTDSNEAREFMLALCDWDKWMREQKGGVGC